MPFGSGPAYSGSSGQAWNLDGDRFLDSAQPGLGNEQATVHYMAGESSHAMRWICLRVESDAKLRSDRR